MGSRRSEMTPKETSVNCVCSFYCIISVIGIGLRL